PYTTLFRQRLEVVAQLVGERLPDLLVPVEVVVLLGDVKEGAVVQNDPGPGRVRSTPLRRIALRNALAQGVDLRPLRVRFRLALNEKAVHARLVAVGDPLPGGFCATPEGLEIHRRKSDTG